MSPTNAEVASRTAPGPAREPRRHPRPRPVPSSSTPARRGPVDGGRSRVQGDGGAVLVEFALIFPLLVFLIFGIFGAGSALNQRLSVTQAGREGARYGATVPLDQCTPSANCSDMTWAGLVQSVTAERSAGAVKPAEVCVALVQGSGSAPAAVGTGYSTKAGGGACYTDHSADTGKRVQVKILRPTEVEAGFMTIPITLETEALTRFEG